MTVNCEAYVRQPKFCMLKGWQVYARKQWSVT